MNRVALVTVYNGQGQLLVGKRNDNQRYTLPGGHLEEGEDPEVGALRELYEETGLRALSLSHLKVFTLSNGTELHCFSAYTTGSPHGKNDPDQEVEEWEWVDVEEGLPPKVYNHLHGPQDEQNLIKQLFSLQKAEWEPLIKRAKVWHSEDWGTKRISIPSMEHPDRPSYDKNYLRAIQNHYGPTVRRIKVETQNLVPKNDVHDTSRYNLYRKMIRAGERLPPLVVRKAPAGHYEILDGNHKYHAAKAEGGGKLDAVELHDDLTKGEVHLMKALKFMAAFKHPITGHTVATGSFHDVDQLPENHNGEYQDGFVDEGGNFYSRTEAATALKATHPGYRPTKLDSSDLEGDWQKTGKTFRPLSMAKTEAKCAKCSKPATVKVIWAEGMAYQPSCDDHKESFKKEFGDEFCNFRPLDKAEDEVYRMLDNPDPVERAMALKLDSVRPEHLFAAALDPDPSVYQPAIDHPQFGPSQALSLMEAVVGKDGTYPDAQKRLFLMRHGRVEPYHFTALARAAKMSGPARYAATVAEIAGHPMAPDGLLRSMYLDPDVNHDSRIAIVGHPKAAQDLLDHAIRTAVTVPGGGAADIGSRAARAPQLPIGTLRALVDRAASTCEPHVLALAVAALEYNQGLETPSLALIFRDLLPKAQVRSSAVAPALLAALLRNPNVSPALADEATRTLAPDVLLQAGVMSNPSFGPRQLQKMLEKAEDLLRPTPEMGHIARHPIVMHQLGFDPGNHPSFRAAKFLSMGVEVTPDQERAAMYFEDGDVDRAALTAYGLPVTDEGIAALHAIVALTKSDPILEPTPHVEKVVTAHPEGEDVAEMIQRAFRTNFVFPVALGGKHSKGSLIAYDEKTKKTLLLKSGSGGAGGAAGSKQDPSDPNAREAAFYYVAKEWGIEHWYPRAEEVILDDKSYAAMQLLALDFKTLDETEKKEPGSARRILHPYLFEGLLHKWAVIDYVLGNPDRHGQNVMVDKKDHIRLIDHGSAFAGTHFDPAHDNSSFVPYYLRAWALDENFNRLTTEAKRRLLPRVPESVARELAVWVESIVPEDLKAICTRYGIDPSVCLARLDLLKKSYTDQHPVDQTINDLWVTT